MNQEGDQDISILKSVLDELRANKNLNDTTCFEKHCYPLKIKPINK